MTDVLTLFEDGGTISGLILPTEHAAKFKALAIEAKAIITDELGYTNDYSMNLIYAINSGAGFAGGPSYASVEEAVQIIQAAVRAIQRKRAKPSMPVSNKSYVDPGRIFALQKIKSEKWDFSRLSELCRELNVAAANRCHMATAMLLRTILNHVPPIFGFAEFAEVANNYGGPNANRSFKGSMQRLQGSLRSIADMHLHTPIRDREDVPTFVQVDFSAELDVLLGELLRISGNQHPAPETR